jgi:1,4-dihydroxy-2-naphthoate octaprenyltransferase
VALWATGYTWPVLAPLLLAPRAMSLTHRLGASCAPVEQIAILADTAKFLALYGALLSVGVVLGA